LTVEEERVTVMKTSNTSDSRLGRNPLHSATRKKKIDSNESTPVQSSPESNVLSVGEKKIAIENNDTENSKPKKRSAFNKADHQKHDTHFETDFRMTQFRPIRWAITFAAISWTTSEWLFKRFTLS
jgi:hypothetical protein